MQRRSIVYNMLAALLMLFTGAIAGTALYLHWQGDQLLSVQSGSMVPAFRPGDAVATRKVRVEDLRVGDIVSYLNPADNRVKVTHRLININYLTGKMITEGDALDLQDVPFPNRLITGKVYRVIPNLGYIIDWLHEPEGLIIVVYTPAAFILVSEAKRLARRHTRPYYQLNGFRRRVM
ncbi:signal peptidase I [soil metagenome]